MELKVGMYVRTKSFTGFPSEIGRITKVEYNIGINVETYIALDNDEESCIRWTKDCLIGEPSYNIIDLIEAGDYVNGFPVIHKENDILKCGLLVQFKENEIKSIVTKECFESMSYKVGD